MLQRCLVTASLGSTPTASFTALNTARYAIDYLISSQGEGEKGSARSTARSYSNRKHPTPFLRPRFHTAAGALGANRRARAICYHAAPDPNSSSIAAICSFILRTVCGCSLSDDDRTYNSSSLSALLRATAAIWKLPFSIRARESMTQSSARSVLLQA